ncbi:PH domain-containing protein [Bifidobacterium cebidarum]|uniref:Bacterial membrane flanked domain superfamily n=1 Tax=Bifidobacterium cebidarum TaxID=2650773 RepID=A0A6I1G817_9BIFI|nr:PH domain-containing protein [Bifidobacterium cebidarum]KAB7787002.1 bacterial membrane flanked domain superfamily [Bifidobacterium cebidarum]
MNAEATSRSDGTTTAIRTAVNTPTNTGWRRLHPASLIIGMIETTRGIIGLFFALLFIARKELSVLTITLILLSVIVVALCQPIINWLTTRYQLESDKLAFKSGLFFRKNRTISYGSIHAINSSQPIYLQPFGVIRLTVSAAGAADTDIRLDAVPALLQLELEGLRARSQAAAYPNITLSSVPQASVPLTASTPIDIPNTSSLPPSPRSPSKTPLFRASVSDILLFAITDIGFLAAALVVYGFVQQVQDVLPRSMMHEAERSVRNALTGGLASAAALILACVTLLMAVSIVTSLLRFYGFEVWRRGDDLVVVRGLLTRHTTTIPARRIQTVTIRQSMLRRPFHLCSVGLGLSSSTANSGSKENGTSAARILPVIGTRRVYAVLHEILPEWGLQEVSTALGQHRTASSMSSSYESHEPNATGASEHAPQLHHTGRGLLRYYLTLPAIATLASTLAVWLGSDAHVAAALRTRCAIPDLGWPWWLSIVPIALGSWWMMCRLLKAQAEGFALLDADSAAHCSSRILVTGAIRLTRFVAVTRRARVQSITRYTALWRESRGIERVQMSLFVMNGIDELRFMFLHRCDAEALAGWVEGTSLQPLETKAPLNEGSLNDAAV